MTFSWLENAYSCPLFWRVISTSNIGHTDVVFGVRLGFSRHKWDYKSLCAAITICATLVNV